jgi:hypothetical protein
MGIPIDQQPEKLDDHWKAGPWLCSLRSSFEEGMVTVSIVTQHLEDCNSRFPPDPKVTAKWH